MPKSCQRQDFQAAFAENPDDAAWTGIYLLGGSWDLVSKVISTLSGVISNYKSSYLNKS